MVLSHFLDLDLKFEKGKNILITGQSGAAKFNYIILFELFVMELFSYIPNHFMALFHRIWKDFIS